MTIYNLHFITQISQNASLHLQKGMYFWFFCRRAEAEQCIMMATKIIGPAIDGSFDSGYNWCIEQVKSSQYMELAHNLDIDKAIGFLKQKDFQQVCFDWNLW